jgi:uncharacterized membrane protein required for colicin V production
MEKVGYFEERPGVKSSTRVNSFILLLFLMAFDTLLALTPGFILGYNFVLFNLVLLIGVFAPKYLQKVLESKIFSKGANPGRDYQDFQDSERIPAAQKTDADPDIDINVPA